MKNLDYIPRPSRKEVFTAPIARRHYRPQTHRQTAHVPYMKSEILIRLLARGYDAITRTYAVWMGKIDLAFELNILNSLHNNYIMIGFIIGWPNFFKGTTQLSWMHSRATQCKHSLGATPLGLAPRLMQAGIQITMSPVFGKGSSTPPPPPRVISSNFNAWLPIQTYGDTSKGRNFNSKV